MKKIFFTILIIVFCGCGKKLYIDKPLNNVSTSIFSKNKKVLILPFKNISSPNLGNNWYKLNLLIYNSISDYFLKYNIISVPFSDIISMLQKKQFIKVSKLDISPSLKEELKNTEWSSTMKKEIIKMAFNSNKNYLKSKGFIYNLDESNIFNINKYFNSRYIILGEISNFSIKQEDTFNPLKIGFLNSPVKLLNRTIFGVGGNNNWSTIQQVFSGVLLGGVIGSFFKEPFEPRTTHKETGHLFGIVLNTSHNGTPDYAWKNAAFWGAATGFSSYIGSHGGNISKITLGLRVYIYDAITKNILWANSIKLHATPLSMFSDNDISSLVEFVVNNSIKALLDNFWNYKNHIKTVKKD